MHSETQIFMDTIVTIKINTEDKNEAKKKMRSAFEAFREVETRLSRFDPESELSRLCNQTGKPVPASDLLLNAVAFAIEAAKLTDGIFDPTIGNLMIEKGFRRNYLTGAEMAGGRTLEASYKDVILDGAKRTILLKKPLLLDLGATAKGLAVDMAAKRLKEFHGFSIDAGGDIYVAGLNGKNKPWRIGIRDPFDQTKILDTITLNEGAVCTSGSYLRKSPEDENTHHLINHVSKKSAHQLASVSVKAPFAMMADAFSTIVFLLGKEKGISCLEETGISGKLVTSAGDEFETSDWRSPLCII